MEHTDSSARTGQKRMRNPLRRRLLHELREEIGKYLVIFLLISMTIGVVSGFLVSDNSTTAAYDEGLIKYVVENGNFRLAAKANKTTIKEIEACGVTVYENFYKNLSLDNGTTLRIYENRTEIDLACVMEGRLPERAGETAIDRMYARNNDIAVGDTLTCGGRNLTVVGYVALPDYSCLFENNSDTMFDSENFGVAVVGDGTFALLDQYPTQYNYSWRYDTQPEDETEEKQMADDFLEGLNEAASVKNFTPRYLNQAITFTREDMSSDKGTMIALLYIVLAIMAFVFALTASDTIRKEANVIGTLRASGYTRGEIVRHYMTLPILTAVAAALIGNIAGYTFIEDFCVSLYYNSYSLPTYTTLWNADAFLTTTVLPILMMVVIDYVMLSSKLRYSPLQFLRRDLTRRKNRRAAELSPRIPFLTRFRIRILNQNLGSYLTMIIGVLFANLLLVFGLGFPDLLYGYADDIQGQMLADYQTMLEMPVSLDNDSRKLESMIDSLTFMTEVRTDEPTAEKFSAYTLKTLAEGEIKPEDVTVYGIEPGSAYIDADVSDGQVWVSSAYADKYGFGVGDTVTLKESYEDTTYSFTITGIYPYDGSLCLFMSRSQLNRILDWDEDLFAGYFSANPITDIDSEYIGSVIDMDAMTKVSRQLIISMGGMMPLVDGFAVIIYLVLIYLLTKVIIEKNAQSISMAKILGYSNREINRLYIRPGTLVVAFAILVSIPVEYFGFKAIMQWMMLYEMSGWIPFALSSTVFIKMVLIGGAAYAAVAVFEIMKIRKVPMDEALKNVE